MGFYFLPTFFLQEINFNSTTLRLRVLCTFVSSILAIYNDSVSIKKVIEISTTKFTRKDIEIKIMLFYICFITMIIWFLLVVIFKLVKDVYFNIGDLMFNFVL